MIVVLFAFTLGVVVGAGAVGGLLYWQLVIAEGTHLGHGLLGGSAAAAVVHRHIGAFLGQSQRDRAADAGASAGHQRGPADEPTWLRHSSSLVSHGSLLRRGRGQHDLVEARCQRHGHPDRAGNEDILSRA